MISTKGSIIYSFILLIITINLAIGSHFNSSESKVYSSRVYHTTNQDNITNQFYKTFSHTNFNEISNTTGPFSNHIESAVNQTDLQMEMALLKRTRRRISLKNNACSHRNSHQYVHKLVDRCARKKTSRRNPKLHANDSDRKSDISKTQSDRNWEKQDGKPSVLLISKKLKNVAKTAPFEDNAKITGSFTTNPYITKKRIGKVHGVNKVNLNNLSRNDILNNKSGIKDTNSQPFVGRSFSSIKGGKHSPIKKITAIKHSHELSMNQVYRKNKQRTNMHSSVKRISNIQKQKKEKEHKSFKGAGKKLNTSISEAELHKNTLKNDDSLKFNNNRNRENTGEIIDKERFTGTSRSFLIMKEKGLEGKNNSSESEKLEKTAISSHDQNSIDVKDKLSKTHQKAKEDGGKKDYGDEKTEENSLKIMKVRRKAGYLKNSRATLQQVNAPDVLSRIRKHSHSQSLKRNTRNERNILYEVKDFVVNHFPKKRKEQEVQSPQTHKNIHRETRNTTDDNSENSSRINRNDITSFKSENGNSKILEEIKDFVVKNFHIERKKRNPLVQQNLIPLARSGRSSKDYENESSHAAIRSKNNAHGKFQPNSFMNSVKESDSLWGDLQGIVKRETEANSISEDVENLTVSEYDYADDANVTEVITDTQPLIVKKYIKANSSTFETTRQSEEENYKSDSDLKLDQYNENSPKLTTNEKLPTENKGIATDFSPTEVISDEISVTEGNLESNTNGKNDSNDQDNVSESPYSNSLPNDDGIHEVTSKHLIEREISTVTNPILDSTETTQSILSNTFNEMSDITTVTSTPVASTFSKSDSTTYENTTPLSTELSSTDSKDVTSVDSTTEWNSGSSSSTHTEAEKNSAETSSVLLSTYSTSEESSSVADINTVQTSLETRAPKVYRDVQHVKEVEDDYEDKTLSDGSTSNTFEEQESTNTVWRLNRIQAISTLEKPDVNRKEKEYKYKLSTITETTSERINKFDNIKISNNFIRKHGGKSQMKHKNYDSQQLAGNMNKNRQKYRLSSLKDQKEESLSTIESENGYDEETVSEETRQVLTTTIDSGKGEYIGFGNVKELHTNVKAHQKMKPHALGNKQHKFENSDVHSQQGYDDEDVSKPTIQDLTPNTERNKAFANTKGKRVNSNIILKGNYQSLGIEFNTFTNLDTNTLDSTKEESSTIKNRNHTFASSKPAIQHKKVNNLVKIDNADEDEYEFQTDSNFQASTEIFASNKAYRKPKGRKDNLKSTQYINESVDEDLDYPPKLIVLHLRNETAKAKGTPTSLSAVSEDSWTNLPEKETKNSNLNNQGENEDEYEDSSDEISHISPTETLETTPKPRILKEYKNRLKKGEKLPNQEFEVYSKLNKLPMTTFLDTQPTDDEMFSQTDKPLKKTGVTDEKEIDKSVNKGGRRLEEKWTRKPTITPNEKLKSGLKSAGLTLNLEKQEEDGQDEIESTRKVEKLPNQDYEDYSKSNKLQMTTLSDTQPFEDEILSQTDKSLKEVGGIEENETDKSVNEVIGGQKLEENWMRKSTISPNEKFKSSLRNAGQTLKLKDDEQEEIESTRKEVERDQTFATYFVTLQNAKIMPDETTTYSTQSTYSDIPRAHESLSRLESINDLGEEYYDEVAHNNQNGERVSKHVSSDNEIKSVEAKVQIENGTDGHTKFDYEEDGINDVERSSHTHETIVYSTASDGLESLVSEETAMNDYDPGVSETESVTEIPEHLQKNSQFKTAGKDKEFVKHLNSLISHLKERRRKSHLESMNHIISRRARAAVTSKPTSKSEVDQVRMPRAKEWWIGGGGIIIMGLLIIGMYHTVIKISKKKKGREKSKKDNDFHAVLHGYETDDEMEDRLSDDVILLQSFIDQVMQNHEISEDGSIKVDYSTAEHMSRIHAATTGTID